MKKQSSKRITEDSLRAYAGHSDRHDKHPNEYGMKLRKIDATGKTPKLISNG